VSRARLLASSLLVVLSVAAVWAAPASARASFEWFVGGKLLAAGEQRTFDLNTDNKTFYLHEFFPGESILLLSTKVTVEHGVLFGGRPGTNEETIVVENVTVDQPRGCFVESLPNPVLGTVRTKPLKSEIVEGQNGEILILFTPKTAGEPFITLLFLNKATEGCSINDVPLEITGSLLGLPLPQKTEVLRQNLVFPSATAEYLLAAGGGVEKAGLAFAGNQFTFNGLTLFLLQSDAVFGPF
jgi:hypothetical protein